MSIAAKDMEDRLNQLIGLTRRLTDLMVAETQALKARKLDASSADWEEKERLAHTYRLEMTDLSRNPDQLVPVPRDLRKSLFEATRRFQEVLAEHGTALAAMREVTEGLVEFQVGSEKCPSCRLQWARLATRPQPKVAKASTR